MQRLFARVISRRNLDTALCRCFSQSLRGDASFSQKHIEYLRPQNPYLATRNPVSQQCRRYSFLGGGREEISIEEEAEKKIGWLFKLLFIGTASVVAYQFVPYMGENVMQQSVALLRVKDPLFKRMGASRLSRFAADDERRMKILEMGGGDELLKMLGTAKDDHTRVEAFKALLALTESDEAVENLHKAGASSVIMSISKSSEDSEVMNYKYKLLQRFQDLKYDVTS
ncbi:hypothetical protein Sjap_021401 [Stephania japonica]|uniref:ARM repeat superfamily protein n=1 Tax=Stephania japonica TaxID=461633 RepID=A0AAP0EVR5_9MAGN